MVSGKKLSRDTDHRRALRRNLAAALFISGRIKTTEAKARFVRPFVEKIITIARKGDLTARRRVVAMLQDRFIVDAEETDVKRDKNYRVVKAPRLVAKVFSEIAPKYANVSGGYTRVIHLPKPRLGDCGPTVYLELVDPTVEKKTKRTRTGGSRRRKTQMREQFAAGLLKGKKPAAKAEEASAEPESQSEQKAE